MATARADHSATLLDDGRVLVTGGIGVSGAALALAEVYDPSTNAWTPVAPMHRPRSGHTATLLKDGRVLIAGGDDSGVPTDWLEIFDPNPGVFSLASVVLSVARTDHAAVLLEDERVLVAGGFDGTTALDSINIYDPSTDTITAAPSLGAPRSGLSATLLLEGKVLLLGGWNDSGELASAELYDPVSNSITDAGGTLLAPRQRHQAFLLPHNNAVLVVGGMAAEAAVASAELYVPWHGEGGSFFQTNAPVDARTGGTGSALSFPADLFIRTGPTDGALLLTGGSLASGDSPFSSAELYGFATVNTDRADYSPGTTVTITGTGWVPGEAVTLTLSEVNNFADPHPDRTLTAVADDTGNIVNTDFAPEPHHLGVRFSLTAIGSESQAQTSFTDGPFTKLQILLPGETAAPGTPSGKTGTPTAQAAGTPFTVTVNAVDATWNVINTITDTVAITSSDANAQLPANAALMAGTKTFTVTLRTVGSQTVTATDVTDGIKAPNTSPATTVTAGAFTKLQLLMPGETAAPGTATGKTGTPTAQTAGTVFTVTIRSVDAQWNLVSSTHTVGITSSDANAVLQANAALVAGVRTRTVTAKTAGSLTVTATDITDGTKTANSSPATTVNPGAFTKLQILLPGEAAAPGTATGKTGTPTAQTAGTAFNVTVNAVDANWNRVGAVADTVRITSSDVNAQLPASAALAAGTQTFAVTLRTAGSRTVTATDLTDGTKTANTSPATTVTAGAFTKLQLLMPGETAAPGTATGKTGTPSARTAGTAFNVTVNAVDAHWNLVSSVIDTVGITSSDANATLPANIALAAGTRTRSVTLRTAGTYTVTATDITDGTKSANTSPATTVNAGAFTKLQLLMPGETAAPGTATGKTGTPTARASSVAFSVTVNAVDTAWNVVNAITDTVRITSTDANAQLPANAALVAGAQTFTVTLLTAGSRTVTATDVTDGTKTANTSPATTVTAGAFTTLQLLMPGETAAPGTATGKTGAPSARTAGTAFTVTVNAVDANWNLVNSVTHTVGVTSSDGNATLPANVALAAGTRALNITLRTAGTRTVTATDITDGTKTANTSPATTVNPGAFTKLQLLMPGETAAPGTATGKTGTPSARTAGTAFPVTVNAVDANWNRISSVGDTVRITSSDPNAQLPANAALVAGTQTFTVTLVTAGSRTVTATDVTDGTKTANTSPATTVAVGAFTKLQLLMPGETAAAGTATGKTGTPTARTAATAFTVTIRSVDAYWNLVSSTHTVGLSSSDANATLPANMALAAGTRTLSITPKTAGTHTLTATDITDGSKTANTSPATTVNPGAFTKLQILLPGETAAPGTATGKTGTPSARTAGLAFNATVNAVDANWNRVSSAADTVRLTSSDTNAQLPANAGLVAGTQTFTVTLSTAGNGTVTVTDVTDGTKTANTSPATSVTAGAFTKLQLLLPGETSAPGTPTGKTGVPTARTAGTAFTVTVKAVDAQWNPISSVTDAVSVTSSDANAALPSAASLVTGTQSFSVTLKTAGSYTVTATHSAGAAAANTSPATTVNPGAFTKLQILLPGEIAAPGSSAGKTGTPTSRAAGTAFNVTVNAVDANWNVVNSVTDTLGITSSDANATLPPNAALAAGTRTFVVTLLTAGSHTATVSDMTDGTKTANSSPVVAVDPGAASGLAFGVQPTTATAGAVINSATNVTLEIRDAYGNRVPTSTASVIVAIGANPGSGTLAGTATVNAIAGIATFNTLSINKAGSGYTLAVASSGLTGATSTAFDIVPGAATHFAVTGSATQSAGTASVLTLTALDAQGNIAASYTGSKSVMFSGASSSLNPVTVPTVTDVSGTPTAFGTPTTIAFTNGVATAVAGKNGLLTLYRAEAATIDATDGTISAASNPLAVQVNASAAGRLAFTTSPNNGVPHKPFTVQPVVVVQDAFGNTVTNAATPVVLSIGANPGSGTLSGTTTVTPVNGLASYLALSIDRAGSGYTLAAASSGLTAATSSAFNLSPGQATRLVFATQPGDATAGTRFGIQPVVKAQDDFGNDAVLGLESSLPLTLSISSGTGTLLGTTTLDIGTLSGNGAVAFDDLAIDQATALTLKAAARGTALAAAISNSFTVAAAIVPSTTDEPVAVTTGAAADTVPSSLTSSGSSSATDTSASPTTAQVTTTPDSSGDANSEFAITPAKTSNAAPAASSTTDNQSRTSVTTAPAATGGHTARSTKASTSRRSAPPVISVDAAPSLFSLDPPRPPTTDEVVELSTIEGVVELPSDDAATVVFTEEESTVPPDASEAAAETEPEEPGGDDQPPSRTVTHVPGAIAVQGQERVTLAAVVSVADGSPGLSVNAGVVTFVVQNDEGVEIAAGISGLVAEGTATAEFLLSQVPAGIYTIHATYDPDAAHFIGSSATEPGTLVVRESDAR